MSISGILSSSFLQNQIGAASSPNHKNLQQLGQDLQSGNLSAAQSDFASLQAAFSQGANSTAAASTASASNPLAQAFNQLATDLQSGNIAAAQKDLSTAQQDIQSQGGPTANHFHHPHHLGGGDGSSSNSLNSLLQDLSQVSQNLTSSSLTSAQTAYATLQQDLQQFALGGGSLSSSQTNALLAQPLISLQA